ncbi:5-hydroxytryptamine receptor 2C-like [Clytia hemisphaerica]|uniref:5-hydroxytryptamine receptor 2C-like n=1 Tax=Clytia hemisphaerica TaxID=252671 RepID=UPI0034D73FFC
MTKELMCNGEVWAPKALSLFTCIVSIFISLIASIGNGIIIFAVIKDPFNKLHTPFNYFLVNLAVADLIVGCVASPITAYVLWMEYTGVLTKTLGDLLHVSCLVSNMASELSIVALAFDRYYAVSDAISYRAKVSWKKCIIATAVIWVISLSVPFLRLYLGYIRYLTIFVSSAILVGSITLIVLLYKVRKAMKKQSATLGQHLDDSNRPRKEFDMKRLAMERKVTKVFFIMALVFLGIHLPAAIMIYILRACAECHCTVRHVLRDLQLLLTSANSTTNPFVLTLSSEIFERAVKKIFCSKIWKKYEERSMTEPTSISTSQQEQNHNTAELQSIRHLEHDESQSV